MAASCRSRESNDTADVGASVEAQVVAPVVTTTQPSRRGMVWIPPGVLVMGTPPGTVPRLADEELPGVDIPMTGYFIDKLPYPNETGAIATTNVSRDEAERMCASLDKRLCTESEWERACKGPAQDRYVGGSFAPATCGVGVPADRSALSPRGSLPGCVSGFGVSDMHGGAFEWTFSFGAEAVPANRASFEAETQHFLKVKSSRAARTPRQSRLERRAPPSVSVAAQASETTWRSCSSLRVPSCSNASCRATACP